MKVKEVIVTIVAGGLLVTGKGGAYVPLLLLLFLIPRENFGEKIKYPVVVGMAVFITIIVFLISNPSLFTDLVGSGKGTEDELICLIVIIFVKKFNLQSLSIFQIRQKQPGRR